MKHYSRIFSMILILMLLFTMAVPAMAEGETPTIPTTGSHSITINGTSAGHSYDVYMIFYGDYHDGVLTDLKWGSNVTHYNGTAVTPGSAANDVASTLTDSTVVAFSKSLTLGQPFGPLAPQSDGTYKLSNLPAGYYLIKDRDNSLNGTSATYTNYIIKVVGNAIASPKNTAPSIEKKVQDINDSKQASDKYDNHQDSADYDIGDNVPFHIHIDLGSNIESYPSYELIVTDTMSAGLTFNESTVEVDLEGKTLTKGTDYTISTAGGENNATVITITFDDLIQSGATELDTISIDYVATLNEKAIVGNPGNPNTVSMRYSNNPNNTSNYGKTPDDTVRVFTYQINVNKTDGNNQPLKGATFKLSKYMHGGIWKEVETVVGTDKTQFVFKGLDDGYYKLEETDAPGGYHTIKPIEFEITAAHTETEVTSLTATALHGSGQYFTPDSSNGALSTTIINEQGMPLPETGGVGTTIFYIAGGLLVCVAIILLVTKKRMNAED